MLDFVIKCLNQPNMKPQPLSTLKIRFPLPCSFHAHYPLVFHPKRNDVFLLLSLKKKALEGLGIFTGNFGPVNKIFSETF